MRIPIVLFLSVFSPCLVQAQVNWASADSVFGILPSSVKVFKTLSQLDGKPNIAWYAEADLNDPALEFTVDTAHKRRLTPLAFYQKSLDTLSFRERTAVPVLVVNCTFFSFASNQNLNTVIKNGRMLAYNIHTVYGRGKDTFTYRHPLGSAIGINKKRKADIAWLITDSSLRYPLASQWPAVPVKDSVINPGWKKIKQGISVPEHRGPEKWKMQTAVGGGPVLVQNGEIRITNNEELKFAGKAISDRHPRTAMGYTADNKLIILVIEGRNPGIAEGATLEQTARMLKDLGCTEALNLDGGGSSCMLINGKETIRVSDNSGQRPVPAVFIINWSPR